MDERYAAVDVLGKGLVLFSSCSHAGICNVVTDAMERFQRPVYMVSGFRTIKRLYADLMERLLVDSILQAQSSRIGYSPRWNFWLLG
jgi:metal-dependent hydrolase (beta-lactamase superfamily II)